MSDPTRSGPSAPRIERWLLVMIAAFIPMGLAMFMPEALRVPLLGVAGVIFVIAFVLMVRQDRKS